MKRKEPRPGFELGLPIPFPAKLVGRLVVALWHINPCGLFTTRSFILIYDL